MASRYSKYPHLQPTRIIPVASSDIFHTINQFEQIDQLAMKYYNDATLGWLIMCGNPDESMEWLIKPGTILRIPFPLDRVWNAWGSLNHI